MKEYKGYFIEYNFYGMEEYSVQYAGDDVMFNTIDEAKAFIDEMHAECCHDMEITRAEATYTGGGIYIYTGKLEDGEYFFSDDETAIDCIYVTDADPFEDLETACHDEWLNAHTLYIITADEASEFYRQVLESSEMLEEDRISRIAKVDAHLESFRNYLN